MLQNEFSVKKRIRFFGSHDSLRYSLTHIHGACVHYTNKIVLFLINSILFWFVYYLSGFQSVIGTALPTKTNIYFNAVKDVLIFDYKTFVF